MYPKYLDTKWIGQGDQTTKNGIITRYDGLYYDLMDDYIKADGKPIYDMMFSKYRIFIKNNMIQVNKTINEKSMFLQLQNGDLSSLGDLRYIYKIHFQPKEDKVVEVVNRILKKIYNDPLLLIHIGELKFMTHLGIREQEPDLPIVVVYIKPLNGYSPSEIQNIVNRILNVFVDEFKDHDILGTGIDPRYNHKINNLIYYAQGHGLLKEMILNSGNPDLIGLLDSDSGFAHFNCDKIGYPDEDCHVKYIHE